MSDDEVLGRVYNFEQMELVVLTCGQCGIRFAVPERFYRECRDYLDERGRHKAFYCPNGHPRVFRDSDIDQLRRERDELRQRIARIQDEKTEAVRAQQLAEQQLRQTTERVSAGVCPCCHRSVRQLADHMRMMHPETVRAPKVLRKKASQPSVAGRAIVSLHAPQGLRGNPVAPKVLQGNPVAPRKQRVFAILSQALQDKKVMSVDDMYELAQAAFSDTNKETRRSYFANMLSDFKRMGRMTSDNHGNWCLLLRPTGKDSMFIARR